MAHVKQSDKNEIRYASRKQIKLIVIRRKKVQKVESVSPVHCSRKEIAEGVIYNIALENEVDGVGGETPLETVSFLQRWPKT